MLGGCSKKRCKIPTWKSALRARLILIKLHKRIGPQWLKRLQSLAKEGKLEQLAEFLGNWPAGLEEEACWDAMCELTRTLQRRHKPRGYDIPDMRVGGALPAKVFVGVRH